MSKHVTWRVAAWVVAFAAAGCDSSSNVQGDVPDAGQDADGSVGDDADGDDDGDDAAVEDAADVPPFVPDPERIYDDIAYLAATEGGGREPTTAGNERALAYVESLFVELGFEPAGDGGTFRHTFDFPYWRLDGVPSVSLDGTELSYGDQYVVYFYSPSAAVRGPVVFVGYGLVVPPFDPAEHPHCPFDAAGYDDYAGVDVTGAVVLTLNGMPGTGIRENCDMLPKGRTAVERGAVAWLTVPGYDMQSHVPHGFMASSLDDVIAPTPGDLPLVFLERTLVEGLVPDLEARATAIGGHTPQPLTTGAEAELTFDAIAETASVDNVLGALPGTDPAHTAEVVLVGAHVDHLPSNPVDGSPLPGADDNAAGTAMMMELARAVALGVGSPARTVVFAAWNAEEMGVFGSCAYAARPTFPLASVLAVLNMDSVGGGDGSGLYLYGGTASVNRWLTVLMSRRQSELGLAGLYQPLPPARNTDHVCFSDAGVAVLSVSAIGDHPNWHTPQDTIDAINIDALHVGVDLMWATLEPLARATE